MRYVISRAREEHDATPDMRAFAVKPFPCRYMRAGPSFQARDGTETEPSSQLQ
jgi:hypothetical protein